MRLLPFNSDKKKKKLTFNEIMILPVAADDLISSSEISLPCWCGAKDKADISTK